MLHFQLEGERRAVPGTSGQLGTPTNEPKLQGRRDIPTGRGEPGSVAAVAEPLEPFWSRSGAVPQPGSARRIK